MRSRVRGKRWTTAWDGEPRALSPFCVLYLDAACSLSPPIRAMSSPRASPGAPPSPGIVRKNTSALIQVDNFESQFADPALRQQLDTLAYPLASTSLVTIPKKTRYQKQPVVRDTLFKHSRLPTGSPGFHVLQKCIFPGKWHCSGYSNPVYSSFQRARREPRPLKGQESQLGRSLATFPHCGLQPSHCHSPHHFSWALTSFLHE